MKKECWKSSGMKTIVKVEGISPDDPIVKWLNATSRALKESKKRNRMIVCDPPAAIASMMGAAGV